MIDLRNISKSFGNQVVFENVNLIFSGRDKIALVGSNGAGKTTLIKMILGKLKPDIGQVRAGSTVFGYVPQSVDSDETIKRFFEDIPQWRIKWALDEIGLTNCDLSGRVLNLSGGQKTRLCLARILARDPTPNMLVLDEPTNNLDSDGLVWLVNLLNNFDGGVIFSSHNRVFINEVANKIVELKNGDLTIYNGNYDAYKLQKEEKFNLQRAQYEKSILEAKNLERHLVIERQRAERKKPMKPVKDNDKYIAHSAIESMQNHASNKMHALKSKLSQIDAVKAPKQTKRYNTTVQGSTDNNKLILRASDLYKSYARELLGGLSLEIFGSRRIRVSGPNGVGKSTLLQIIAGKINPDRGDVKFGSNVRVGYMSQELDNLDISRTGLENLEEFSELQNILKQAKILGLTRRDMERHLSDLSYGQRVKIYVLKLLLGSYELLVLDEPTNHLDIETRELIENALSSYRGAMIVASHDQYFISQIGVDREITLG